MFYLLKINSVFNWSPVIRKQHKKQEVKYVPLGIPGEYTSVTELADLQISFLLHIKSQLGNFILFYFQAVNNLAHITKEAAMPEERMTEQQIKDEQLLKV